MEALKGTVSYSELEKLKSFIENYQNDEEVFIYRLDQTSFIIVTEGECSKARVNAEIAAWFNKEVEILNIK